MERQKVVEELHKPARRRYKRRKYEIRSIDETWQADLVEMIPYFKENKGFRYLLTVIDIFSKHAWAVPVKSKSGNDVSLAMSTILKQGRVPTNLQTDQGKEFYNSHFQNLMKKYKINLYSSHSNLHASICERFNRTLKNKMWIQFSNRGNYKWLDILPDLLRAYNSKKHRTIGIEPENVTLENEREVKKRFPTERLSRKKPKYKIGDSVRISKIKNIFEKGYTPNWSTEIFTITKVAKTNPITYHVKDYYDKPVAGGFYETEIQKTKYPEIYHFVR